MFSLENKIALVTGASRGIGRAIAAIFAKNNAKVFINYNKNTSEAEKTLELMGDFKNNAELLQFDVSDLESVNNSINKIITKYNKLDILVNNAGICIDNLLPRFKEEDFDRQININLKGAFICSKAAIKYMIKNRYGRIINISSIVGEMGNAGQSVYASTKAGLIGMTKSLAKELSSRNILVNVIAPGYIETDMTKNINKELLSLIPLKRAGSPDDIATTALFLASDEASYITGQVISVNGGLYL